MARNPDTKSAQPRFPHPPRALFTLISTLPESLPARLDTAKAEGWRVITIVQDRRGNDHVAYLSRD